MNRKTINRIAILLDMSKTEKQVFIGMIKFKSINRSSDDIGLSRKSVEYYRNKIYDKLGVKGRKMHDQFLAKIKKFEKSFCF